MQRIKIVSKKSGIDGESSEEVQETPHRLFKFSSEARPFKLIDSRDWTIASSEPSSESIYFTDGHAAMNVISVLGPKGVGKSSLLNLIAQQHVFKTYSSSCQDAADTKLEIRHKTRGLDIYANYRQILLDSMPILSMSVYEDLLDSRSASQFPAKFPICEPLTSSYMISLQLATFLMTVCDHVIIMTDWLLDINLFKLISTAIMMIGNEQMSCKLVVYSNDERISDKRLRLIVDNIIGKHMIEKFFFNEKDLINHITPYSSEKCQISAMGERFNGMGWFIKSQQVWSDIRSSTKFVDYAAQLAYCHVEF